MKKPKPRLVLYVTEKELKRAKELAQLKGLRTPQQWALSVIVRAMVAGE